MSHYQKPPELYDGLRLHQNENTGGCSPRVLEALARLRPDQIGFYPPYAARDRRGRAGISACRPTAITLVNGLDEGIMAVAVAYLRAAIGGPLLEAIVPEPAFEIFRFDTAVAGGTLVQVMPQPDFSFPLDEVLAAITPNTRVVFLTNPNNPTGVAMPLDAIRTIARRVPPGAVVFVDEAYAEFAGVSFIPELAAFPNVIVGRTFSKAFGLAGLRIGCLVGAPATLDPVRRAVPVYSVNIAAAVAVHAALDDLAHLNDYLRQVDRIEGAALRRLRSPRARRTGRARRTSCWSAPAIGPTRSSRARSRRASTCATARPSPAAPAASASPPASSSTRAAPSP